MKCPHCGAEVGNTRFCEYCGSQITAEMQKEQEVLNKKGCPKCGSSNIQFKRENQGEVRGKHSKQVIHRTVGVCKDCGATWFADNEPKKRKTWLWVLGWIFVFPLPLTILLLRKKDMNNILKYGIIAVAWILYLIIGFSGGASNTDNNNNTPTVDTAITSTETQQNDSDDSETLKKSLKEKEGLIWFGDVRNDVTGNWRLSEYSSSDSQETFAVDYYNAFFENDKEIHAVINMATKTTARISIIDSNTLDVTIQEYVDGEEHDAKELFGGMKLKEYWVYLDSGKIEEIKD